MRKTADPRGYQRVYGKPVYATKYLCYSCGRERLGFGYCKECGSWVDKIALEEGSSDETNFLERLLCRIGFHDWDDHWGHWRECRRCRLEQSLELGISTFTDRWVTVPREEGGLV